MKHLLRLALLAAVIVLGVWAWGYLFPNPKRAVHRQLDKIVKLSSFPPDQGNFTRTFAIKRLEQLFAPDVHVVIDMPGYDNYTFNDRAELMQAIALAKRLANGVKAEFIDINIEIGSDNTSALVDLTLKAKIGSENDLVIQEFNFTFKKIDGNWLVTRIESVKPLKP